MFEVMDDMPAERYRSALGDRRETPVPCWACRTPTLALDATCEWCHQAVAALARRRPDLGSERSCPA